MLGDSPTALTDTPKDDKKKVAQVDKAAVEPTPKRADFFEWLERLFYDEPESASFPEKIEVRVVSGKNYERLGPMIKQIIYGPGKEAKPPRTKLVELSNEILFRCQRDCDIQRRQVVYGIHVSHFSREVDFYERWLLRCQPTGVHALEGAPRGDDGSGGEDASDASLTQTAFTTQVLGHHERMFSLYGGAFEGLLDRMDRVLERQENRIEKQDFRIEKMTEILERALSLEAERAERREWQKLKVRAAEKGLDVGLALAPPLLNHLMSRSGGTSNLPAGSETPETLTLKNFFKKVEEGGMLTKEQADAAFGVYDDKPPYNCVRPGVLSLDQARILWDVSQCKVPVDELDKLMPGGMFAISFTQVQELQTNCGLTIEQLAPLHMIFEARQKKMAEKSKTP